MTNIVYIQDQLCTETPFFNDVDNPTFAYDDDKLPHASFILSSSKNCGLLILINKLLASIDAKIIHQGKGRSCYRLADQLLLNFHRSKITILPSSADDALDFVLYLLSAAKHIASHNPLQKLYPLSKDLIDAVNAVEAADTDENIAALEKNWKEFSFNFFREKLNLLMNS